MRVGYRGPDYRRSCFSTTRRCCAVTCHGVGNRARNNRQQTPQAGETSTQYRPVSEWRRRGEHLGGIDGHEREVPGGWRARTLYL